MGVYDSDNEHEPTYELVIPLLGCRSNGGPYEDEAFVAGICGWHSVWVVGVAVEAVALVPLKFRVTEIGTVA